MSQNTQAIIWKIIACAAFAGVNCIVRYLTGGSGSCPCPLSAHTITFFQNVFGFLIMVPVMVMNGVRLYKTNYPMLHNFRVGTAVIGIIAMYSAFSVMPMAQALALQFIGPVFSVLGAKIFLGETVGRHRTIGIIISIIGAFFVARPERALITMENDLGWSVLLPLLSAVMFSASKLIGRDLGVKGESPQFLAIYLLFFMIPASGLPAALNWVTPGWSEIGFLIALGGCGCLAHYATAQAYCKGEVSLLTPFGFTRIFFTVLLGIFVFDETIKDLSTYIGYLFVIIGMTIITWGEANRVTKQ